jgi:hypothetical protein
MYPFFLVREEPFCQGAQRASGGMLSISRSSGFVDVYTDTKLEFIRRYFLCGFIRVEIYPLIPNMVEWLGLLCTAPVLCCTVRWLLLVLQSDES